MKYLQVRNWDKFQHYKKHDGPPLWIKLHRTLLSDYEFQELSELNQARLIKLWLLAASTSNRIPDDPRWVARQIGATSIDLDVFVSRGFLEEVYSDSREPLEAAEQRRTEQKRAEKNPSNGAYEIPEHEVIRLLAVLKDKDALTENTIRRICKRNHITQNDLMVAREAAMSGSARSPAGVAISELKKRGLARAA